MNAVSLQQKRREIPHPKIPEFANRRGGQQPLREISEEFLIGLQSPPRMIHMRGKSKTDRNIGSLVVRDQISKRILGDRDHWKVLEQRSDLSTNASLKHRCGCAFQKVVG
jgi:hypothetical protein